MQRIGAGSQSEDEEETSDTLPRESLPQHLQEVPQQQIFGVPSASSATSASTNMALLAQQQQQQLMVLAESTGILLAPQSATPAVASSSAKVVAAAPDPEQLFPHKLFNMLHDAERQGFTNVVSWGKDSPRAFRVHKKREFERLVLPQYFKMTKYKSFTRQLHNYEFLWVRSGEDKGGYSHPAFDRNDPSSCTEISRRMALKPQEKPKAPPSAKRPKPASNNNSSNDEGHVVKAARGLSPSDSGDQMTMAFVQQQSAPPSYQQRHQQSQLPLVNFQPQHSSDFVPTAVAASYQLASMNPNMYVEEEKLAPTSTASMARAPHPHPLESLLEPRTIEEMLQDPKTGGDSTKPAAKHDNQLYKKRK